VAVSGGDKYVAISAGYYATCAIRDDGSTWCWGYNAYGQLGNGTVTTSCTPTSVANLEATQIVATGGHHACALLEGGTLRCWGDNARGQLGDGTTTTSSAPVEVLNQSGSAVALAAGDSHSCAALTGGAVVCWGANDRSQLGDGTTEDSSVPVTVVGVERAMAVGAGFAHNCVLLEGGTVQCWGSNSVGQIGSGPYAYSRPPTMVTGLTEPARSIGVGDFQSCAVLASGAVQCWGAAPVGDGTNFDQTLPVNVLGVSTAVGVSGGYEHTCAWLDRGREVLCWGRGYEGELGDGNTARSLVPVTTIGW
jgi:alpha-tubulin suppressor-like RCC1 family protein